MSFVTSRDCTLSMVTPLTTPRKSYNSKFPLFHKLLHDSQTSPRGVCPATAPVLSQSLYQTTTPSIVNMERTLEETRTDDGHDAEQAEEATRYPIVLLDPPQSKLKRQLSIDTVERTDALRIRKRVLLQAPESESGVTKDNIPSRHDEVDGGGPPSKSADNIHIDTTTKQHTLGQSKSHTLYANSLSIGSKRGISASVHQRNTYVPEVVYAPDEYHKDYKADYKQQPSPNNFNLSDIGLTSPFANLNPRSANTSEKDVFIFPDNAHAPSRKLSPYKTVRDEYAETRSSESRPEFSEETIHRHFSDSLYKDYTTAETPEDEVQQQFITSSQKKQSGHCHVTARGFLWPDKAAITEPIPISPRIVTTDARPRFQSPSTSSDRVKQRYDEDLTKAKLHRLEREYARAKEIYGSPPVGYDVRQMSPTSRGVENIRRGTHRSISNKDRSPNETDIRETNDDVRNRYERSFSDPRYSPRQIQSLILKPSPLSRQYEGGVSETMSFDVRRRLFMKGDPNNSSGCRSQSPNSQFHPPGTSTEIPDEVLQFLHSRNFHPEELENLKDVLRHGGSPHTEEQPLYMRSPSVHFDESRDIYARYRQDAANGHDGRRTAHIDSTRDRKHGDIDVRLSCDDIKEKKKKTEDMLNDLEHDNKDCKCAQIEQEIRLMAMGAYSKIRRTDRSAEAHDQFQSELQDTNANVYTSMKVLCGIKCLCKYGRTLDEVYTGSVVFRLNCPTVDALLNLWNTYKSGDLLKQLNDAFISDDIREKYECEEICLNVSIALQDYLECKQELEDALGSSIMTSPIKCMLTPVHARSRSEPASVSKQANQILQPKSNLSPFRERICSDSSVELSPRRAFQEINAGKHPVHPPSPSKKYVIHDNVVTEPTPGSPLTSPRRKPMVFKPPPEQENVETTDPIFV